MYPGTPRTHPRGSQTPFPKFLFGYQNRPQSRVRLIYTLVIEVALCALVKNLFLAKCVEKAALQEVTLEVTKELTLKKGHFRAKSVAKVLNIGAV